MDFEIPLSSGDPETDSLVERRWLGTQLSFGFPTAAARFTGYSGGEPFNNFEGLNAVQQAAVRTIFASISTFTNLSFSESTGADAANAVLRFGMTDDTPTAHAYLPSTSELGGDSWYRNTGGDYDDPVMGNYAWLTFMHEIGHTLGFGHPHESTPPMDIYRDWMPYTVMSYRSSIGGSLNTGYTNEDWGFAQTYMMEDIAALQFLYGANFTHNSSDTSYRWDQLTGEMSVNGVGQGAPGGNRVFLTIWDGGGNDTYDFSNYVSEPPGFGYGLTIDLRPGQWTRLSPSQSPIVGPSNNAGNIANAMLYNNDPRSIIENAIGSTGNDIINGNQVANHLVGGGGSDELLGYAGDDILEGGDFSDTLRGGDGNDTLYGDADPDQLFGDAGNDILYGGAAGDDLRGGDGDDWIEGGDFHDGLQGDAGNDTLLGGEGNDGLHGGQGNDSLDGGTGDDILGGDAGDDVLTGGDGNDTLDGGSGTDSLTGGIGNDRYYLDNIGDQVVELPNQGVDTVIVTFSYTAPADIENIELETAPPGITLTGNASNNVISGNYWGDIIIGGAGADEMRGAFGDDIYYVDNVDDLVIEDDRELAGFDTVYSSVSYALREFAVENPPAGNPLQYGRFSWSNQIELLILTGSANSSGTGNSLANTIQGNSGNNMLDGGGGDDLLSPGTGSDTAYGGDGNDGLYFGADLTAGDNADGGAGSGDQLAVQGNYAGLTLAAGHLVNIEALVLLPGNDTRFGDTAGSFYSYNLTTVDANVGAGQLLTVNFNTLRVGENVTFNGSAETNGSFLTYGGLGNDGLTGGQQSDGFYFGIGRWGAGDSVDGQAGSDQLGLQGLYSGGTSVAFGATQLAGVETLALLSGGDARFGSGGLPYSYNLTMHDGNVAAGQTMTINANTLLSTETLTFNGAAETSGKFTIFSGAGADTITGSAGADTIYGGGGADVMTGGAGNDVFAYLSTAHSTSSVRDTILDFKIGDQIDLLAIDANATTGGNDAFSFIGSGAFTNTAGELRAFTADGANWLVQGDTDGNGVADLEIYVVASDAHPITASDFVL